ncbi:hypothetical protein ACIA03_29815 [Nocardioides sp. NPDC051685]|uniref:hypothetical protein n=1 Tax=Nocardioides sp. NPDC051685 TaxID=3364334 RepID=UPI00379056DC
MSQPDPRHEDYYFNIASYQPSWRSGLRAIKLANGRRLGRLRGLSLTRSWLLWERTDDEWFADAPVVLDFAGEQLEIQHQKFDELSITWNTIDPFRQVPYPDFDLAWRDDAVAELARLHARTVTAVDLLEYRGDDMANGMVAVGIGFGEDYLVIQNNLDENGLAFGPPQREYYPHPIH